MRIKILIACGTTSFIAALVNHFILKVVDGAPQLSAGLLIYQFITVIFVGVMVGIGFALESSDFDKKTIIKPKSGQKVSPQQKNAWQ